MLALLLGDRIVRGSIRNPDLAWLFGGDLGICRGAQKLGLPRMEIEAVVMRNVPPAFSRSSRDEILSTADNLLRQPQWSWAHPSRWQQWESLMRRCDIDTLRCFLRDIKSSRMLDTYLLDWMRPMGGIVTYHAESPDTLTLTYDDRQPHSPEPSGRYMCRCKECPGCGHVWISPYSFRVCPLATCNCLLLPHTTARRRCRCMCEDTLSMEDALDYIQHSEIRIPQLCHYIYGKTEKNGKKALARARARARAQGGGSSRKNKAVRK